MKTDVEQPIQTVQPADSTETEQPVTPAVLAQTDAAVKSPERRRKRKAVSRRQVAANRRNAEKSTGPRTAEGRAAVGQNAVRHGMLSHARCVARGAFFGEDEVEFAGLQSRFREELRPCGPVEELLVDQVVTCHWRLRRVMRAEAGEVGASVDRVERPRQVLDWPAQWRVWEAEKDTIHAIKGSARGLGLLENWLGKTRVTMVQTGDAAAAVSELRKWFGGRPNRLIDGLEAAAGMLYETKRVEQTDEMKRRNLQEAVAFIDRELQEITPLVAGKKELEAREAVVNREVAMLPGDESLAKIGRYEARLTRQMFRALKELRELQREARKEGRGWKMEDGRRPEGGAGEQNGTHGSHGSKGSYDTGAVEAKVAVEVAAEAPVRGGDLKFAKQSHIAGRAERLKGYRAADLAHEAARQAELERESARKRAEIAAQREAERKAREAAENSGKTPVTEIAVETEEEKAARLLDEAWQRERLRRERAEEKRRKEEWELQRDFQRRTGRGVLV